MEVLYLYCVDIKKGINLMANAKKKEVIFVLILWQKKYIRQYADKQVHVRIIHFKS